MKILNTESKQFDAFWDFNINPISFDIVWFLSACQLYANINNYSSFKVNFIPEKNEQLREYPENFSRTIDLFSRRWRKWHICYQSLSLFDKCKSFSVHENYESAIKYKETVEDIFPLNIKEICGHWEFYKYINENLDFNKTNHGSICNTTQSKRYIQSWFNFNNIKPDQAVSITLRQLPFDEERNNNTEDWLQFANFLKSKNYHPIFVLDSDYIFEKPDFEKNFTCIRLLAFNIQLRSSFYETCKSNFFVSSGPAALAQLNSNTSYAVFNIINSAGEGTKEDFQILKGFNPTEQPKFTKKNQIFFWNKDKLNDLVNIFEKIINE